MRDIYTALVNYHREAKKGYGTPSSKYIEEKMLYIAKSLGIQVVILFQVYNQSDTNTWLEKNGYKLEQGNYIKIIG